MQIRTYIYDLILENQPKYITFGIVKITLQILKLLRFSCSNTKILYNLKSPLAGAL